MSWPRRRRCCGNWTSHAGELRLIDADLARVALERAEVLRLMTVPGIDATVAPSIVIVCGGRGR